MTPYQEFLERQRIRRASQIRRVLFNQPLERIRCHDSCNAILEHEKEVVREHLLNRSRNDVNGRRLKLYWMDRRELPKEDYRQLTIADGNSKRAKTVAGSNARATLFPTDVRKKNSRIDIDNNNLSTIHTPIHSHRSEQQEKKRSHTERKGNDRSELQLQSIYKLVESNSPKTSARMTQSPPANLSVEGIKKLQPDIRYCKEY